MENKRKSIVGNAMYIALFVGGANIILGLLFWAVNLSDSGLTQLLTYFVLLMGIIIGTVSFRNKELNGTMSYGKAFTSGLLISDFTAIILAFFFFILIKFIDPELLTKIKETSIENMLERNPNMSEAEIDKMSFMYSAGWMTFFSVIGNTLIGLLLSLITAIFIKRENNSFENKFKDVQ